MSASKKAKNAGLKSLSNVVRLSGWPRQTLVDMERNHPTRFDTVLLGCQVKQAQRIDLSGA